jgi:hypothetical protein
LNHSFTISAATYDFLLDQLNQQFGTELPGKKNDLEFINTDFWLQDTAVLECVEKKAGAWNVALLFVHHLNPLKFIKRTICSYADIRKANTSAHYMRRQAAKDQRGTLVVNTQSVLFGNS